MNSTHLAAARLARPGRLHSDRLVRRPRAAAGGLLLIAALTPSLTSCAVVQAAALPFGGAAATTSVGPDGTPPASVPAPASTPSATATPARPSATLRPSAAPSVTRTAAPAGSDVPADSGALVRYDMGGFSITVPTAYGLIKLDTPNAGLDQAVREDIGRVGQGNDPDLMLIIDHYAAGPKPLTPEQAKRGLTKLGEDEKARSAETRGTGAADLEHLCTGPAPLVAGPALTSGPGLQALEYAYDCPVATAKGGSMRVFHLEVVDSAGRIHSIRLSASPAYRAAHADEIRAVLTSIEATT